MESIDAKFLKSTVHLGEVPHDDLPQVAMVGRSNVGKSSLINHLTGRKAMAKTSSRPGRTQTINVYDVAQRLYLIDLPGYGYAQKSQQQRADFADMILEYLEHTTQLRLVLLVVDASIPPMELDYEMMVWLRDKHIPFVIVMNKIDKLSQNELKRLRPAFDTIFAGADQIAHSLTSDVGCKQIWQVLYDHI